MFHKILIFPEISGSIVPKSVFKQNFVLKNTSHFHLEFQFWRLRAKYFALYILSQMIFVNE